MSSREITEEEMDQIRLRLSELYMEHGDLDDVTGRLSEEVYVDQLQIQRLKKRKLYVKDMIGRLESRLIPDLDA